MDDTPNARTPATDEVQADAYFAIVPEWILDHPDLSDRAVRLYGLLARYADKASGEGFPGRKTLAARLRTSVKSVDRALAELVEVEAVEVRARFQDGAQRSNLYVLRRLLGGATPVTPPLPTDDAQGGDTHVAQNESQGEREETPLVDSVDADPREAPDYGFERVWQAYPKRNGKRLGKAAALRLWKKHPYETKARIFKAVQHYAAAVASTDTIPRDFERFLKADWWEGWEDGPGAIDHRGPPDPTAGTRQGASSIMERNRRRAQGEACPECQDAGFVLDGNTAVPCRCRKAS